MIFYKEKRPKFPIFVSLENSSGQDVTPMRSNFFTMKKTALLLFVTFIVFTAKMNAQLTGVLSIPGNYPTLAAAITDLNAQGVGPGGVVFLHLAGFPETAPAGGYVINTTTSSAANPVVISGNGNTLTASPSHTVGALNDAIFKIIGSDYIGIQGYTMQENAANVNTTPGTNTMTEWGVALLHASTTNGAQGCVIMGNTISLNRTYTNSWGVYSNSRHTPTSITVTNDAASVAGTNSNNTIVQNIISNVNMGVAFIGAPGMMDDGNVIGSGTMGNTITNWGGAAAASGYVSNTGTSYCIFMNHQMNSAVRGNSLSTSANPGSAFRGIFLTFSNGGPTSSCSNKICANTVSMSSSAASGAFQAIAHSNSSSFEALTVDSNIIQNCAITNASSTTQLIGISITGTANTFQVSTNRIFNNTSASPSGGFIGIQNTITISGNSVLNDNQLGNASNNAITFTSASTGLVLGIMSSPSGSAGAGVSVSGNIFHGFIFNTTSSSAVEMIRHIGSLNFNFISNNIFNNLTLNTTGAVVLINNPITGGASSFVSITNNAIVGTFSKTGAGGSVTCIAGTGASAVGASRTIQDNSFSNITTAGGTIGGITETGGASTGAVIRTILSNTMSNWSGGLTVVGIDINNTGTGTNVSGNTISNISTNGFIGIRYMFGNSGDQTAFGNSITGVTSTGLMTLMLFSGAPTFTSFELANHVIGNSSTSSTTLGAIGIDFNCNGPFNVHNNTIYDLNGVGSGASPTCGIFGIFNGLTSEIHDNKIYDLEHTNATGVATGIHISNCASLNIYNNYIGDIRAGITDGNDAVMGMNVVAGTTLDISYNTIYLANSAGGTNSGSSGIRTATGPDVTLRNNLVVNLSTQTGTGVVVAHARATTSLVSYNATSNNNSFFAGTPSAANLIFFDGTNSDQTLAQYQTRVGPSRDAQSVSENPAFSSLNGIDPDFLHIPAATATLLESGGTVVAGITTDWDVDTRPGPAGSVNGGALAPDIGADEFDGILATCSGAPAAGTASTTSPASQCVGNTFDLELSGHSTGIPYTYQWQEASVSGGPYTNISGATSDTYTTVALSNTMYYVCVVTCTVSGMSSTSTEVVCTINPDPVLTFNPVAPALCDGGSPVNVVVSGANSYAWSPSSGLNFDNINNPDASPAATTTYTVVGTDVNGCTSSNTVTVTVNPLPTIGVTATPDPVCAGTSTTLSATGADTYIWQPLAQSGSSVSDAPAATTTYTVTGTDVNGCTNTETITVTVVPSPTVTASADFTTVCAGSPVELTGSGATTYQWDPGAISGSPVTVTPASTTTYTVVGTDGNGCTGSDMVTINVTPLPSVSATATLATICEGESTTLDGFGALTYTWMPGSLSGSSVLDSPTATTTYTVTGTDGSGCTGTATVLVTVNPLPTVVATPSPASVCDGENSSLSATGANGYVWFPGFMVGTPVTVTPAATTTYTVVGTDVNGCTNQSTATVVVNTPPTVTSSATPATICAGTPTTLDASGALTYNWMPGSLSGASVSDSPLSSTTYTVTGTDVNGCTGTSTVFVDVLPAPTVGVSASAATICAGSFSMLTATGATTYTWMPGSLSGSNVIVSPASTTTYTVTGDDGSGCTSTATITITVNPLPVVTVSGAASFCQGGSTTLTASAGPSYQWYLNGFQIPAANSQTYVATAPGIYNVLVTLGTGCADSAVTGHTLIENPLPTVSFTATPSLTVCSGTNVTLSGTGATSYAWTGGISDGIAFTAISTDTYTVTGTDANGCTNTDVVTVTVNPLPTIGIIAAPSATVCAGSPVTLSGTGATSYTWTGGVTDGLGFTPASTQTYTVTGTDGNGCTNTNTVTVTVNPLPVVSFSASPSTTVCSGTSITLSGSGATSYTWSGGITDAVAFTPASTQTYSVIGTDANGCTGTDVASVTVNPQPTVSFTASPSTSVCAGTAVTLSGTGASTYTWTGGVTDGVPFTPAATLTYTVSGTDINGCTGTSTVTVTVNPLPVVGTSAAPSATVCAGGSITLNGTGASSYTWSGGVTDGISFVPPATATYSVTGTDGNGCTNTATILVTVNPAPTIGATSSPAASVCTGTAVTLNGTGGVSYTWSGGITDGVAFVPPSTTTYVVTGTDASGCTGTSTVTITVNPNPTVSSTASPAGPVCSGTMVTLSGTGASSYTWSGGITDAVAFSATSTQTYTVTGTDGNGCTGTATATVTVNPAPSVTASASPSTSVCNGSPVTLTGGGATTYTWTGGVTDGVPFTAASTQTYTVTGTDAIGCSSTATITVTVGTPPSISSTATPATSVCAGTAVTLNGTGGVSYVWSGGITDGVAFTPASTQTYTVTGTDAGGCTNTAITTITVNPAPSVTTAASPATTVCSGTMVTLNGFGGATYTWTGGVSDGVPFSATATQTYTVTGTDMNGCTGTSTITITVDPLPNINSAQSPAGPHCAGATVTLNGIGGVSYTWSGGVTNGVGFVPLATTTYTVTGTGFTGCTNTNTITVVVNPLPVIGSTASPATTVCSGTSVTLNGTGAATYTWTGGVTNGVAFTPASSQSYTVTGVDGNGCTGTATTSITVNPTPTVTTTAAPSATVCAGNSVTLNGGGGVSYTWSGGITDGVAFTPASTTTYTVTGTAANGCTGTATVLVTVNPLPVVGTNTAPTPIVCSGTQVTLNGTGAATYVWTGGVSDNVPFTATTTSSYTVTGTAANGCTATATTTVTVNTSPTVSYNATPGITVCYGTEITLDGTGAVTYMWSETAIQDGVPFTPLVTDTVQVIGTDGNGCIDSATVIITVDTLPVVTTAFSPNDTLCENAPLTLMGAGAATYVWSHGVTDNVPFPASATTTYTVIGTDGNGCADTTTLDIIVNPAPVVVIAGNSTFCTGGNSVLTSSPGSTYQWFMNGSPLIGSTASTYTATLAGVYNVWVTNANGCGDSSATGVTVTINTPPVVAANATATSICAGSNVTLNGSGASTYAWSGGVNDGVPFSPLSTLTYTVVGTALNGCTDSDTISVVVNALPVVSTSGFPAYTVCENTAVTLNGNGAATYSWTGGVLDGVPFTPSVTDTYTVTGTDLNGCTNTETVTVTVNANPVVNLGPDSAECGTIMLDAGNAGSTYVWSTTEATQTITATASGTYIVDVTSIDGCTSSDTVVLTINAQPVVVLGTDDTLCAASVTLDAMNAGGSYLWNDFSTGQTNVVTSSGTYYVEVTMPGGCVASDTITLVLNTPPVVTLSLPIDTACLNMGSVMLSGESPAGGTWSGPAVSGNSFDPMIAGIGTFGITYTFVDTNGCAGIVTDSMLVDPCLSVLEPIATVDFNMYPNPNNGEFSITVDGNETVQVLIYNGAGQLIIDQQVNAGEITPVSLEASGIYLVTVIASDGQQLTKRVMVNR